MKSIVSLAAPCLLLSSDVGARRIHEEISQPSSSSRHRPHFERRIFFDREAYADAASNDLMNIFGLVDSIVFDEMSVTEDDCEGAYADWSGGGKTRDDPSTVVRFDYDVFVEKGGNLNAVLNGLQNKLLRRVGRDVFSGCSRRLVSVGDVDLNGTVIEEISTKPSDQVSDFESCKIEDADSDTDCFPILGFITAYYSSEEDGPSEEDVRRLDESKVHRLIKESVERAMESSEQVFYLGDRETYSFDFEESYLTPEEEEPPSEVEESRLDADASGVNGVENDGTGDDAGRPWWPVLVGSLAGVAAIAGMVGVAALRNKKKSKKGDDQPAPVEAADEDLVERGQASRGVVLADADLAGDLAGDDDDESKKTEGLLADDDDAEENPECDESEAVEDLLEHEEGPAEEEEEEEEPREDPRGGEESQENAPEMEEVAADDEGSEEAEGIEDADADDGSPEVVGV